MTGYPDNNPKTVLGLKKPAMSSVPPTALIHLMRAMADGRRKYGLMNWRENRVSSTIYYDAAMRHLMAWFDGEQTAIDSGVHHLGHAMACLAIVLDAEATGNLNDDRPTPGAFGKLVSFFTEHEDPETGQIEMRFHKPSPGPFPSDALPTPAYKDIDA